MKTVKTIKTVKGAEPIAEFQRAGRAVLDLFPGARYALLSVTLGDDVPAVQIPVTPEGADETPSTAELVLRGLEALEAVVRRATDLAPAERRRLRAELDGAVHAALAAAPARVSA